MALTITWFESHLTRMNHARQIFYIHSLTSLKTPFPTNSVAPPWVGAHNPDHYKCLILGTNPHWMLQAKLTTFHVDKLLLLNYFTFKNYTFIYPILFKYLLKFLLHISRLWLCSSICEGFTYFKETVFILSAFITLLHTFLCQYIQGVAINFQQRRNCTRTGNHENAVVLVYGISFTARVH